MIAGLNMIIFLRGRRVETIHILGIRNDIKLLSETDGISEEEEKMTNVSGCH